MKRAFGEQRAELPLGVVRQLALEHRKHRHGQAFAGLQNDVADEAVAHDHVHVVLEQIMAFDVADEIQIQLLAELEGFEGEFVAFGFFRADAQNADARVFAARISRE